MKKEQLQFVCAHCGMDFPKWQGRCSACGEWNTLKEFRVPATGGPASRRASPQTSAPTAPLPLRELSSRQAAAPFDAIKSRFADMDRVLGNGVVPGSLVLIGGDPGIGKSTLLLQLMTQWSSAGCRVLYVSGEESAEQLSLRARRLGAAESDLLVLAETSLEAIFTAIEQTQPRIVVVDSIQTMFTESVESAPGSVAQVRESAAMFLRHAKKNNVAVFLIGHVTKDGAIAGPRLLEHMVDTVLYFEGDTHFQYRMVRAVKNRYGPAGEVAVFTMTDTGLAEVADPSELFIHSRDIPQIGSALAPALEGSRVLVVELQALVNKSHFGLPQRVASGINPKKLSLLLAVLERHGGIVLGDHDIFFNIAGGIAVGEPAIDLGIVAAVISSFRNKPLRKGLAFIGELGLGGEIRPVNRTNIRLREIARMGFTECCISGAALKSREKLEHHGLKVLPFRKVGDIAGEIF
jgi:DNA repair protein RadA/Sms